MPKTSISIRDVAELAQVSHQTVSRVFKQETGVSEKTRERVLKAAQLLEYAPRHPKPQLTSTPVNAAAASAKMVALLIPDITTTYMGEILRGVSSAAERLNYGLMLYTQGAQNHEQRTSYYLSLLKNQLVDGALMVVPLDYELIVSDLEAHGLKYVLIDHHNGTGNEPSVTATNRRGVLDAMRYLLALGHRRIGFITGRMDIACSLDRLQGYQDGLAEVGIAYDNDLVREGDFMQPTGFEQGNALLELAEPPTAIIASNDVMAFGVMDAAKAADLEIGRDISIIGFDDIFMTSQVHPTLTTIRQPLAAMGETALEMLVTMLKGGTMLNPRRELPTELIIRKSTGPARK